MKKNIDNKRLDEMLTNIYKSEPSHTFQYNCDNIPDENKENTVYTKTVISGSEHIRKNGMTPSKLSAIAAACVIAVTGGIYINRNSFMENMPAAQFEQDEQQENTLFEEYLEEFENEMENYGDKYECLKVSPNGYFSDDPNVRGQNLEFAQICYNKIPECSNAVLCYDKETNDYYAETDEEFYFYVKCLSIPYSNYLRNVYTRQAYLVWKDENGNITKIIPSAEKYDTENINVNDFYDSLDKTEFTKPLMEDLISEFHDETNDVYFDDVLVRPAIEDKYASKNPPSIYCTPDYYTMFISDDNKIVPVTSINVHYSTDSVISFDDEYYENVKDIPFFRAETDEDGFAIINKTFIYDCSGDELVDISAKIERMNENYWLEEAACSPDYSNNQETVSEQQTNDSCLFTLTDIVEMSDEQIEQYMDKFGDGLTRKEDNSGYNLCSYCLEQQGYDLHDIKIFDDADLTMSADEVNDIICKHNIAPDEEIHWLFTKENILEIEHNKYRLTVHYRTPKENMTKEESELNESFHNCVWAELTLY